MHTDQFLFTGKPLRMIYGDGGNTGNANTVAFDDWEPREQAREVHFLWPDGFGTDSGAGKQQVFFLKPGLGPDICFHSDGRLFLAIRSERLFLVISI